LERTDFVTKSYPGSLLYIIKLSEGGKPIFVIGYVRHPQLVEPAHADFTMVSPTFNSVDVRKIPKRGADGNEQVILLTQLYPAQPWIREYQFSGDVMIERCSQPVFIKPCSPGDLKMNQIDIIDMFRTAGIEPSPRKAARERRLKDLADLSTNAD
jgi:hypothetical protein